MAKGKSTTSDKTEVLETETKQPKKKIIPKKVDTSQFIEVLNGAQSPLIYESKRTGEVCKWSDFGEMQELELRELRDAKNFHKKFFINNWFMFGDEYAWVIDYLGVGQYYKNAINIEEFDDLFSLPAGEVGEKISKLSKGQKKSVAYRARQLISERQIDSLSVIDVLEKSLGIELIEH